MDVVAFVPTGDYQGNTRCRMLAAVAVELLDRGRGEKMLCVERPICPISTPLKHTRKFLEWLAGKRRLRQVEENVWAWTPSVLIHDLVALKRPSIARLNMRLVRRELDAVLYKLGMTMRPDLVVWIFHPYQVGYLDLLPAALQVYECWDDHQEFAAVKSHPAFQNWIGELERGICDKADLVFATSQGLAEKMSAMNSNVVMVPNGVDFTHFNAATYSKQGQPNLNTEDGVRIGFIGKINEKLDFALLSTVSARRPEWTFILVGPFDGQRGLQSSPSYQCIRDRDNVQLVGEQSYDQIPAIVATFDVCMIPFTVNDLTRAIYPLKLHEYLAVGKPVVSTDLPEMRQFPGVVYLAHNTEQFEQMIETALVEDCPELRKRRAQVARENSWQTRAKTIVANMERTMAARNVSAA